MERMGCGKEQRVYFMVEVYPHAQPTHWLFLFPSSLTSPSLQDGLKFFECSLIFDYIPGQGRLWILFIKNPGALSVACLSAYLHMLVGRATLKGQQHDRCLDRCEWREYRLGRGPGVGHQRLLTRKDMPLIC